MVVLLLATVLLMPKAKYQIQAVLSIAARQRDVLYVHVQVVQPYPGHGFAPIKMLRINALIVRATVLVNMFAHTRTYSIAVTNGINWPPKKAILGRDDPFSRSKPQERADSQV